MALRRHQGAVLRPAELALPRIDESILGAQLEEAGAADRQIERIAGFGQPARRHVGTGPQRGCPRGRRIAERLDEARLAPEPRRRQIGYIVRDGLEPPLGRAHDRRRGLDKPRHRPPSIF
jgi:hypothetical protein